MTNLTETQNKTNLGWIDLSENEPPFEERVLVCIKGLPESEGVACLINKTICKTITYYTWNDTEGYERSVTHWRELPKGL